MRALAAIATAVLLAGPALPAEPGYLLIVNANESAATLDRKFVADAFLKKVTHWPDDQPILPVDMVPSSAVRRAFSEEVLDRSISAVKSYWQQMIFSGRNVPGPELDGDDAVISYVAGHPGAIGYVSAAARLHGVRVLTVR